MSDLASFNAPSVPKKRTWDACAGLHEAEAPLAHLDGRVVFEEDYPEPIRYDAERKKLRYRGFMSHASYVKLAALCDEREYQAALERLFVATSPLAVSSPWQVPWKGIGAAVAAIALLVSGWYARSAWLRPEAASQAGQERVVTQNPETTGDVVVHGPQATGNRPEGEARRPVER
jgi:hypothetical protein